MGRGLKPEARSLKPLMIIAVLDDLFFSIKIKTAAKTLGAEVYFERSPDQVLESVRSKAPRLVIFDLDSVKMRPMEAIAAIKGDPALTAIPTLGFVSHVHDEVIARARAAGIDQVLARSAFVDRLGSILGPSSTSTT